jgi:hypothetical protein
MAENGWIVVGRRRTLRICYARKTISRFQISEAKKRFNAELEAAIKEKIQQNSNTVPDIVN